MTKAKSRRFQSKLSKIDTTRIRMDKKIDALKQDSIELGMAIEELRAELRDDLDDTPKRPQVVRREAHA